MQLGKLLLEEMRFRKLNVVLSTLAVCVTAALVVAGPTLIDGYRRASDQVLTQLEDQTRRLMRDLGFNLMIVHRDTNMADLWAEDFAAHDMPEAYVERLAASESLTLITHLVATLQQKTKWNGRTVLVVGYLPEATQSHMVQKKPMGYVLEPGTVLVGYELGHGLAAGDEIELLGRTFRIARLLPEKGSKEDVTIVMNLADAQALFDKPGRVNQIMALGCRCEGERLPQIRAQLEAVLPETRITESQSIAVARAEQREAVSQKAAEVQGMLQRLAGRATPLVVVVCGIWVGLLALANVRERRFEIGLLRALGKSSSGIAGLFLGKAVLVGLIGGAAGCLLGAWFAQGAAGSVAGLGPDAIIVTAADFRPSLQIVLITLLGAPLLCLLASYLPTLLAIVQNPAVVLRDH